MTLLLLSIMALITNAEMAKCVDTFHECALRAEKLDKEASIAAKLQCHDEFRQCRGAE